MFRHPYPPTGTKSAGGVIEYIPCLQGNLVKINIWSLPILSDFIFHRVIALVEAADGILKKIVYLFI